MIAWIFISVVGVVLSIWGFIFLIGRFRKGLCTKRYLYAMFVGYISFVSYAVISVVQPEFETGIISIVILLPAFVSIVVLISENAKKMKTG